MRKIRVEEASTRFLIHPFHSDPHFNSNGAESYSFFLVAVGKPVAGLNP